MVIKGLQHRLFTKQENTTGLTVGISSFIDTKQEMGLEPVSAIRN